MAIDLRAFEVVPMQSLHVAHDDLTPASFDAGQRTALVGAFGIHWVYSPVWCVLA